MLLATGLPTQDLYNAQIDIRVAATIPTRPETSIILAVGRATPEQNARSVIRLAATSPRRTIYPTRGTR